MAEKIKPGRERSWGVTLQEIEKWGQVQAEGTIITQSKARGSILYLGNYKCFDVSGEHCVCDGCKEIPGTVVGPPARKL